MANDKKIIIFDFDGVFYSGEHKFDLVEGKVKVNRHKFFPNISSEIYKKICKENPEWENAISGHEIAAQIWKIGKKYPNLNISTDAFWNWQQNDRYEIIIDKTHVVNVKVLQDLCKKYHVYIVSNSSPNHLKYYMNILGINPKWFIEIISNKFIKEDITKYHYYKEILEKENIDGKNAYVFGDSEEVDLLPAKLLGINTYLINNANEVENIIKKVL